MIGRTQGPRDSRELLGCAVSAVQAATRAVYDPGHRFGPDHGQLAAHFNQLISAGERIVGAEVNLLFPPLPEPPCCYGLTKTASRADLQHVLRRLQSFAWYLKDKVSQPAGP